MIVGKMMNGKIVEITRVADQVKFSDQRGWICIVRDFQTRRDWQQDVRWIPASTPFVWIRSFNFG